MRVKFRRWGPYVWWICPSRKCNFENKTDLAFVQGVFETKCQYCNTPITIKLNLGQLELESSGAGEEESKPAAAPPAPKPSAVPPTPQASAAASTIAKPAPATSSPKQGQPTPERRKEDAS